MSVLLLRPLWRHRIRLPAIHESAVQSVMLQPARSTASVPRTVVATAGHVTRYTPRQVRRYGGGTQVAFAITQATPQLPATRAVSAASAGEVAVTWNRVVVLSAADSNAAANAVTTVKDRTVVLSAARSTALARGGSAFLATPGGLLRWNVRPIARYVSPPQFLVREQGLSVQLLARAASTASAQPVTEIPPPAVDQTRVLARAHSEAKAKVVSYPVFDAWTPIYAFAGMGDPYSPRFIRLYVNEGEQTVILQAARSTATAVSLETSSRVLQPAASTASAQPVRLVLTRVLEPAASSASAPAVATFEHLRVLARASSSAGARVVQHTGNRIVQVPAARSSASVFSVVAGELAQLRQITAANSTAFARGVQVLQGTTVHAEVEFDTFLVIDVGFDTLVNIAVEPAQLLGV